MGDRGSLALLISLVLSAGCITSPLGSGLLVHPETDENGVGVVKYRVGGYEIAKQQMFNVCRWPKDVQIVEKEIGSSSIEEAAVYANNVAAAGNTSSADVSTVSLSFVCVDRADPARNHQAVLPPKPKPPASRENSTDLPTEAPHDVDVPEAAHDDSGAAEP